MTQGKPKLTWKVSAEVLSLVLPASLKIEIIQQETDTDINQYFSYCKNIWIAMLLKFKS